MDRKESASESVFTTRGAKEDRLHEHTKVSRKLPLRYGCISSHAVRMQKVMCITIFIAGCLQPRNSVIKSHMWLKCPLQISQFFCNRDVPVCTMGCKRGLKALKSNRPLVVCNENINETFNFNMKDIMLL